MADDAAVSPAEANAPSSNAPAEEPPSTSPEPSNRDELLAKARTFLQQPQVQREDASAKRRFLAEKGLNETEIQGLLRELPVQIPSVPPRSYPQPPPSNLPILLLGLARLLSWIAGGSAFLLFVYHRLLAPRVAATFAARASIKAHQLSLIQRLNTSLNALKESQADTAAVLPKPEPYKEPVDFASCVSIDALMEQSKKQNIEVIGIPPISLLRSAIADFRKGPDPRNPKTEEVFQLLEGKIPWLASPEGAPFEQRLWETLSTCPLFKPEASTPSSPGDQEIIYWAYTPPEPSPPTALAQSLAALEKSIPKPSPEKHSAFQHALQSMTDFTGHISTQMYPPYIPMGSRYGAGPTLSPAEEDVRKEIRALKGLVLNRRSFMPRTPVQAQ